MAMIVTRDARSSGARSVIVSSGRASSGGMRPGPRSSSGPATETTATSSDAQPPSAQRYDDPVARRRRRRSNEEQRDSARTSAPLVIASAVSGGSTMPNVRRLAHISVDPCRRGCRAEPREHADADPGRRERRDREQLAHDERDVEDGREMHRIEETHRRDERHEPRGLKRKSGIQLQEEHEHVARAERRGERANY